MKPASEVSAVNPLASPKSQILSSQSALTNKLPEILKSIQLPGFKSRCSTLAE